MTRFCLLLSLCSLLSAADKAQLNIGRDLFRENCAVCHDVDKTQKETHKLGPSLNHVLSSGRRNRPYIAGRVKFGGPLMPAFRSRLSANDIDTLLDYLDIK